MPPSVSNQQEHWRPATPAYFGSDDGSAHGTKHHSQSFWKGEKFLLAAQGGCHGRYRTFLGKPFALLPFWNWRLLWFQFRRIVVRNHHCCYQVSYACAEGYFPSTSWEGICPCESYTIKNNKEMNLNAKEAQMT